MVRMVSLAQYHTARQQQGRSMTLVLSGTILSISYKPGTTSKDYSRRTDRMLGNSERNVQKGMLANTTFMGCANVIMQLFLLRKRKRRSKEKYGLFLILKGFCFIFKSQQIPIIYSVCVCVCVF